LSRLREQKYITLYLTVFSCGTDEKSKEYHAMVKTPACWYLVAMYSSYGERLSWNKSPERHLEEEPVAGVPNADGPRDGGDDRREDDDREVDDAYATSHVRAHDKNTR